MSRIHSRRFVIVLVLAALATCAGWLWEHRYRWIERNFRAVEPGRIYAGGYQFPGPLERIVKRCGIKTVLSLRRTVGQPAEQERQTLAKLGVKLYCLPLSGCYFQSSGKRIDAIEQAGDFLADPANQPVYVHCWAGRHRASAAVAAYRWRHCGWKQEQIEAEAETYGSFTDNSDAVRPYLSAVSKMDYVSKFPDEKRLNYLNIRADFLLLRNKPAAAAEAARRLSVAKSAHPEHFYQAAELLVRCSRLAAREGSELQDQAAEYAAAAVQCLRKAKSTGHLRASDSRRLETQSPFASLKDRDDFQALLRQL